MGKDQLRCLGFISYSVRFCGRYSYSLLLRYLDDALRWDHDWWYWLSAGFTPVEATTDSYFAPHLLDRLHPLGLRPNARKRKENTCHPLT